MIWSNNAVRLRMVWCSNAVRLMAARKQKERDKRRGKDCRHDMPSTQAPHHHSDQLLPIKLHVLVSISQSCYKSMKSSVY